MLVCCFGVADHADGDDDECEKNNKRERKKKTQKGGLLCRRGEGEGVRLSSSLAELEIGLDETTSTCYGTVKYRTS